MASSFDERSQSDETFHEVMALYSAIMDNPGSIKIVRAEMRQGEVKSTCLDFKIDVELKAKRAIVYDPFAQSEWAEVMAEPNKYESVSEFTRKALGKAFNEYGLGVDGAYKMLYWRTKNNKYYKSKEETSGIFG